MAVTSVPVKPRPLLAPVEVADDRRRAVGVEGPPGRPGGGVDPPRPRRGAREVEAEVVGLVPEAVDRPVRPATAPPTVAGAAAGGNDEPVQRRRHGRPDRRVVAVGGVAGDRSSTVSHPWPTATGPPRGRGAGSGVGHLRCDGGDGGQPPAGATGPGGPFADHRPPVGQHRARRPRPPRARRTLAPDHAHRPRRDRLRQAPGHHPGVVGPEHRPGQPGPRRRGPRPPAPPGRPPPRNLGRTGSGTAFPAATAAQLPRDAPPVDGWSGRGRLRRGGARGPCRTGR